jgi:hypothetical protein
VRRRGPSKQRLWLGAGQYRDGCRNAATNTDRYADSCVISNALRGWNTYAYSYSYRYGNSNSDGYGNCNAYSERNTDTDGHANGLAYRYAQGDTKASSDSASPADSVVRLGD